MPRTELETLGEFGLIKRLSAAVQHYHPATVRGIGDDAAVLDVGSQYLLTSTDLLVEGVHFDLGYVPLKHLGYKAIATNVSDIAPTVAAMLRILEPNGTVGKPIEALRK